MTLFLSLRVEQGYGRLGYYLCRLEVVTVQYSGDGPKLAVVPVTVVGLFAK